MGIQVVYEVGMCQDGPLILASTPDQVTAATVVWLDTETPDQARPWGDLEATRPVMYNTNPTRYGEPL